MGSLLYRRPFQPTLKIITLQPQKIAAVHKLFSAAIPSV
jgi:hypothetical protein